MAEPTPEQLAALKRKRTFKRFSYRGIELEKLLDKSQSELTELLPARIRRRLQRRSGILPKHVAFMKRVRTAKKNCAPLEKPAVIKTHLRNMPIIPEMIGSVIAIYNGKVFAQVEIKPEMIGHYLGEFSCSYKRVGHGRAGIGATKSSRFIPLK
eukprot:TRINITY_DN1483_c0_g2_i1.p2 TRINITY_DN1483_c0_g2~~TRINITY_DN1483_c0_g2_i1.p2  ORF type:complete len:154 (+),score=13.95 TRINITY_DN1483_c0_g2_i1:31-492(+)